MAVRAHASAPAPALAPTPAPATDPDPASAPDSAPAPRGHSRDFRTPPRPLEHLFCSVGNLRAPSRLEATRTFRSAHHLCKVYVCLSRS